MNDESTGHESHEAFEIDEPRSIFSALWFRLVIGVAALGVVAGVAVPYVLDWTQPPLSEKPGVRPVTPPETGAVSATRVAPQSTPPLAATEPSSPPETAKPVTSAPGAPAAMSTPSPSASTKPPSPVPGASEPRPSPAAAGEARPPSAETTPTPFDTAARVPARMAGDPSAGSYWVQVGAYKDGATAERLAARLRESGYNVTSVTEAPAIPASGPQAGAVAPAPALERGAPGADSYDVVVSGGPAARVTDRLVARGLVADVTAWGVIVRPPLPLAEAISLSKELATDGLQVQVRRAGLAPASKRAEGKPSVTTAGGPAPDALHRVRVGAYPDQATALAAARELSAKGYEGFVARVAH